MDMSKEDFTLEDFILALSEGTGRLVRDKNKVYEVVAFILSDLLYHSEPTSKSWH